MTKIFIPENIAFSEIKIIIGKIEKQGLDADNISVGGNLNDLLTTLKQGDTIVVQSLDVFPSLIDLLTKIAELQERQIKLQSINEPWLNKPVDNTADFLEKLRTLAVKMHARRTNIGLQKARAKGKTLGRNSKLDPQTEAQKIEMIEQAISEKQLSVTKACEMFDMAKHTLYNHRRKVLKQTAQE